MRDIKFRAWDKKRKKMLIDFDAIAFSTLREDLDKPAVVDFQWEDNDYYFDVELMQYTGLKDKNGKEIYEGDIVKYKHDLDEKYKALLSQVVYEVDYARFNLIGWMGSASKGFVEIKEIEVIGNIYENPELLVSPPPHAV